MLTRVSESSPLGKYERETLTAQDAWMCLLRARGHILVSPVLTPKEKAEATKKLWDLETQILESGEIHGLQGYGSARTETGRSEDIQS